MRIIPWVFILFTYFIFSPIFSKDEVKKFDNLVYIRNPSGAPKNLVDGFIPEDSTLLVSTELKKFGFENVETAIIFESPKKSAELLIFYEILLKTLDWRILQMERKDTKSFILAEMRMRELITISTETLGGKTLVKIFLKKQSGY